MSFNPQNDFPRSKLTVLCDASRGEVPSLTMSYGTYIYCISKEIFRGGTAEFLHIRRVYSSTYVLPSDVGMKIIERMSGNSCP